MTALTDKQFVAALREAMAGESQRVAAKRLGVAFSTLQKALRDPSRLRHETLATLGYQRVYRNGARTPPLSAEDVRAHAAQLVRQCGSYRGASESLGLRSVRSLYACIHWDGDPEPHVLEALGLSVRYAPIKG